MWLAEKWNLELNFSLLISVERRVTSNAKTLWLHHLSLPALRAGS